MLAVLALVGLLGPTDHAESAPRRRLVSSTPPTRSAAPLTAVAGTASRTTVPPTTEVGAVTTTTVGPTTVPPPTYPPVTVKRTTPVRGPIVDPWRPPSTHYGPGNRGIDIGTVPGAVVVSPADGLVTFAGTVGDARFVVVESPDGVRITIGFLAAVRVRSGQTVRRGQVIGRAGKSVHVGARVGDDYLDPTPLFSGGPPHIRLIAANKRSGENSTGSTG